MSYKMQYQIHVKWADSWLGLQWSRLLAYLIITSALSIVTKVLDYYNFKLYIPSACPCRITKLKLTSSLWPNNVVEFQHDFPCPVPIFTYQNWLLVLSVSITIRWPKSALKRLLFTVPYFVNFGDTNLYCKPNQQTNNTLY